MTTPHPPKSLRTKNTSYFNLKSLLASSSFEQVYAKAVLTSQPQPQPESASFQAAFNTTRFQSKYEAGRLSQQSSALE
jgi:hypothetical protein